MLSTVVTLLACTTPKLTAIICCDGAHANSHQAFRHGITGNLGLCPLLVQSGFGAVVILWARRDRAGVNAFCGVVQPPIVP